MSSSRKADPVVDKRRKMESGTHKHKEKNKRVIKNLFDCINDKMLVLENDEFVSFVNKCTDLENKELLLQDFNTFMSDEKNRYEFLSLFYHSYEASDTEIDSTIDNETAQMRYFMDTRVCFNCGEAGHIDYKCPKRIQQLCILCGDINHVRFNCPQIVCTKCGRCGHKFRECKEEVDRRTKYAICSRCPNRHTVADCPLSWRRYRFDRLRNTNIRMSCCYCLSTGHFIDDCNLTRSKTSIFTGHYERMVYCRRRSNRE